MGRCGRRLATGGGELRRVGFGAKNGDRFARAAVTYAKYAPLHALAKPHFYYPNPTASDSALKNQKSPDSSSTILESTFSLQNASTASKQSTLESNLPSLRADNGGAAIHKNKAQKMDSSSTILQFHIAPQIQLEYKKLAQLLESTFEKTQMDCHADFQSARNDRKPSPHTLESSFSHDTPFLSSRDFRKEVVAIHISAKADSSNDYSASAEFMDCHAIATALARNDRENAQTLKTPQAQAKLDSRNEAQNLKTPAKDSRICDEKSGLSSDWQESYLSGNDRRQSRRIHDLSRKAESTSQIY